MKRHERLDIILRMLRDRPGATVGQLAEELGTSPRSLFRDIAELRDRGYPIESSRGRGGGLRLHANWGLGRILLASDEALSVLLSLAVAERIGMPMFATGLARARRRLVDAFPASDRRRLAPLRERVLVGPTASGAVTRSYGRPDAQAMRALQAAFVTERVVAASYVREDGQRSDRRLEPHALLLNWPAWYLLGHDRERDAVRTFRLDRFASVREESETFRPRVRDILGGIQGLEPGDPDTWRL